MSLRDISRSLRNKMSKKRQQKDPGGREDDYPNLKRLEYYWMVTLGSLGSMDPAQGCNRRDDAKAGAKSWRT